MRRLRLRRSRRRSRVRGRLVMVVTLGSLDELWSFCGCETGWDGWKCL